MQNSVMVFFLLAAAWLRGWLSVYSSLPTLDAEVLGDFCNFH